jgi:hypothetical protein
MKMKLIILGAVLAAFVWPLVERWWVGRKNHEDDLHDDF